jgi:uncharacterized membrane protein YedE/YeeE
VHPYNLAAKDATMQIDWLHFTPVSALIGGVLLGAASALLFLNSGRILGITGVLEGLISPNPNDTSWRFRFMLGLLLAPPVAKLLFSPEWLSLPKIEASFTMVMVAGLLVGVGTRLGTGCTSGHGICGLGRLSARSLAATLSFMFSGFATVYVLRHVL